MGTRVPTVRALAVLAMITALISSCGQSRKTLLDEVDDPQITSAALSAVVFGLASRVTERVETAADSIIDLSDDPEMRRRALVWKIYAIPEAQLAVFQLDPLVAALDTWVFAIQMRHYFETGGGVPGSVVELSEISGAKGRFFEHIERAAGG